MSTLGQASGVIAQTTEPKVIFSYLDPVKGNYGIINQPMTASELFTEFCTWAYRNGIPMDWNLKSESGNSTTILYVSDWDLSAVGTGDIVGDVEFEGLDQPRFEIYASAKTAGLGVIVIKVPSDPKAIFTEIIKKAQAEGYDNPTHILPREEFYLDAENNKLIAKGWHVIVDSMLPQAYSVANGWIDSNHSEIRNTKDIAAAIDKKMMQLEQAQTESTGNEAIAEDSNTGINTTQENNTAMAGQEFIQGDDEVPADHLAELTAQAETETTAVPAVLTIPNDGTGAWTAESVRLIDVVADSAAAEEIKEEVEADFNVAPATTNVIDDDIGYIPNPLEQTFDKRFVGGSQHPDEAFGRPDDPERGPHESAIGGKPKREKKPRDQSEDRNFLVDPNKKHNQRPDRPQREGRQERAARQDRPNNRPQRHEDEAPTFQPRVGRVQIDSNILSTIKDRLAKNTQNDGEHFININFSGKTELGRALDMTAHAPFDHPEFGHFESVTAFLYYITATETDETLRSLHGVHCRNRRRTLSLRFFDGWKNAVADAIWLRVSADPKLMNWMIGNDLPYRSQYLDPDKNTTVTTQDSTWQLPVVRTIERALKDAVKYPDREVVPNFNFLNDRPRNENNPRPQRRDRPQRRAA